jgi:hypothetical protein
MVVYPRRGQGPLRAVVALMMMMMMKILLVKRTVMDSLTTRPSDSSYFQQ